MGRRLVVADHKKAKHAIKRVARFMGYLIQTVIGRATGVLLTLDWTDPQDGVHQIVALNLRAHGRALPLAWVTAHKDGLKDQIAIRGGIVSTRCNLRARWAPRHPSGRLRLRPLRSVGTGLFAPRVRSKSAFGAGDGHTLPPGPPLSRVRGSPRGQAGLCRVEWSSIATASTQVPGI